VAISDCTKEVNFLINYSSPAFGLTKESSFYPSKFGHEITVQACSFDELVEAYHLCKPDVIKIDIEGAEAQAVAGMTKSIPQFRPVVLLEVHGRQAAEQTFQALDWEGYRFLNQSSQLVFSSVKELLNWFPDQVRQIYCLPN
jgi:chemotaxis response regulator CheB